MTFKINIISQATWKLFALKNKATDNSELINQLSLKNRNKVQSIRRNLRV